MWFTSSGTIHPFAVIEAVNYILSKKDIVRITNHSYAGYGGNDFEKAAFKHLEQAGIIVVAGSGNESKKRVYNLSSIYRDRDRG